MTIRNETTLQTKNNPLMFLFEMLALLYIMHDCVPIVGYYMPSIVYLGLFGVIFLLALPAFTRKGAYVMLGFFAVSLLTLVVKMNNVMTAALYLYGELQIYLFGLIALTLIVKGDPKQCRRMFWFIVAMYALTAVTTMIGNNKYPQASRVLATLASDDPTYKIYTRENIGGFLLVYSLVLLTPLIIYLIKNKRVNVVLGAGLLVLIAVTLLTTEYGMAVLLFSASLTLLLIPKLTTKKIAVLLIVVLLIAILFGGIVADLFESISVSVESDALAERFMVVAEVLRGEDRTSSLTAQTRTELYGKSWSAFVESSLLGQWDESMWGIAGGHSYILDTLGKFGILGIVALIILFATMYKIALKPYNGQAVHPYLFWIYLMAIVLMVLNPKSYGLMFLLIIPLLGHGFGKE